MLGETEVKDDDGNIVISPGLKVRHKKSQYEYTVDDVVDDPSGEIQVILRMPEEPRFEPPPESKGIMRDNKLGDSVLYEVDPEGLYVMDSGTEALGQPEELAGEEDRLAVPQEEFEREYEVR